MHGAQEAGTCVTRHETKGVVVTPLALHESTAIPAPLCHSHLAHACERARKGPPLHVLILPYKRKI